MKTMMEAFLFNFECHPIEPSFNLRNGISFNVMWHGG